MINSIEFKNVRIIYPDYTGTGRYNTYHRSFFNIIVTPEDAAMMEQTGIKVKLTKPSQNFPDPQPYTEVAIGFAFLNTQTGLEEASTNPPIIVLHDKSTLKDIIIDASNLDVLNAAKLSNVNITVSQSTPKINQQTGKLSSRFYLRTMEADVVPFFSRG